MLALDSLVLRESSALCAILYMNMEVLCLVDQFHGRLWLGQLDSIPP